MDLYLVAMVNAVVYYFTGNLNVIKWLVNWSSVIANMRLSHLYYPIIQNKHTLHMQNDYMLAGFSVLVEYVL